MSRTLNLVQVVAPAFASCLKAGTVFDKMGAESFKDRDALAFADEAGGSKGSNAFYVGKRKRKSKGLEVVFDQDQHRYKHNCRSIN